ncbi:hypothetical protein GCM10009069_12020 [Algimonas arctica]|uniref:Uncharacterized protein n=1 Tax=Algimonas arctica TaxID=1479486 RepID=A0A8J3CPJ1_9PROT|nr:hypothetical protein [Algimonas arctica]GHA90631.1 hypothetical protein GCM10009069_12020 [Algimonas arctica]
MQRNILAAFSAAMFLSACSTSSGKGTFRGTDTRNVESAVMSPANDIGLDDIEIPGYLTSMTNPYYNAPESCDSISTELAKLDAILGDDVDVPEEIARRREQNALNATSSTIGSVLIPFRGVVRVISGAASNERDARQAYERGLVRRAYLKGMSKQMACRPS